MRKWQFLLALGLGCPVSALAQQKAFPEAEGFGRFAAGARTNLGAATVYHVTNLNDSGPGSFRDAVSQSNRFIVFDVGGIVTLNSAVSVDKSNLTIAGQTAPGGISFYGDKVSFSGANNLIARHIAIRKGEAGTRQDTSGLSRGSNMIFDHLSVTWGVDETFSMNPETGQTIDNITIQNSIIAQGLDRLGHSAGGLMTLQEGGRFSIIKSLFADSVTRNPKVRGENEFINNVVYGWETAAYIMGDTTSMTSHANAIGNYFIEGPVDGGSPFTSGTSSFHIYGNDNWVDTNRNGSLDGSLITSYPGANVVSSPFAFPTAATMTAQQTVAHVIENVGLSIIRDAVDQRLVDEVASYGTLGGVILRDTDLFPAYNTDPKYLNVRARLVDTDNDGMADNWETSRGLNPNSATDFKTLNAAGYTRLEEYLNELGADGVDRTSTGGNWTSGATWAGNVAPTLADDAIVSGSLTLASGNGFARRLTLVGDLNVTGGTLDVFDTAAVNGTATIGGGTVTAGRVLLGSTGQTGSLTVNAGGTLQTATVASAGGTASLALNGGTVRFLGVPNITVPLTVGASGGTLNTNGYSGAVTGGISGTGTLTKTGAGTLTLGGNNAGYSGGINLNAGAITLATNGAASSTGVITLANGTAINVATSGASTPIALANGATGTIAAGGVTYAGAISGAAGTTLLVNTTSTGNFSLGGSLANFAGTLDLAATTGNVRINQGGSALANFDTGDATGALRVPFGGTVNLGSLAGSAGTKLQGSTNDSNAVTFLVGANGNSTTFAGTVTNGVNATPGIVNLTKTGSGTLALTSGASTYTGATTVNGGTLAVSVLANGGLASSIGLADNAADKLVLNGGTLRYTGAAVSTDRLFMLGAGGGAIDASGSAALTLNGAGAVAMSGAGDRTFTLRGGNTGFNNFHLDLPDPSAGKTSLTKDGAGTWRLFGNTRTYSGDTHVKAGSLYLVAASVLPSGAGKGNVIVDAGATIDMYGNSHTINGLFGGGTITTTQNTARTLTVGGNDAHGNFAGILTQGASQTLHLTKTGTGTQTLSGENTYAGLTTINGGTLLVNGTHAGGGNYTVNNGGTLGGTGSTGSAITVNNGGALSPGASAGTLSVGNVTLAAGADFIIELNGNASYDQLAVTGTAAVGGADLVASLNYVPQLGDSLFILVNDAADVITGQFAGLPQGGLLNLTSSTDGHWYSFRISYVGNADANAATGGNDVLLTAVPEPAAATTLLLASMAGLLSRRRGRRL
ncbi:MAG TPA: autotransporter-associated beta strand repeat-containing protein [Tepidisphaeraceae bacterium]|nr:autotransporter-associated beta strand repeat-containing protein [Tepidisphaeraceae bacterium]